MHPSLLLFHYSIPIVFVLHLAQSCRSIIINKGGKKVSFYERLLKSNLISWHVRKKIAKEVVKLQAKKNRDVKFIGETALSLASSYTYNTHQLKEDGWSYINHKSLFDAAKALNKYASNFEINDVNQYSHNSQYLRYPQSDLVHIPEVQDLLLSQKLNEIASQYLQAPAQIKFFELLKSYPNNKGKGSQLWHRDRDDFAELKLFIYCSDVDENSGPHGYIAKSQILNDKILSQVKDTKPSHKKLFENAYYCKGGARPDDTILKYFPKKYKVQRFTGAEGTAFLEDTTGLHRGYPPREKPRLMFNICFCVGLEHFNNVPEYVTNSQRAINTLKRLGEALH